MVQRFVWDHAWKFPSKALAGARSIPSLILGPGASEGVQRRGALRAEK
jgi:hypothetical protein